MSEHISKCLERLRNEIGEALSAGTPANTSVLYSLSLKLQLEQIPAIPQLPPPFLIWGRPHRNFFRIGLGTAIEFKTEGAGRFRRLQNHFETLRTHWHHDCRTGHPHQPGAFCAFAFDEDDKMEGPWSGVPNTLISVPELLLEFSEGRYTLTLSCQYQQLLSPAKQIDLWLERAATLLHALTTPAPQSEDTNTLYRAPSEPTNAEWMRLVEKAKTAIKHGQLDKVVPARYLHIRGSHPFNETAILKHLAAAYPSCLLLGLSLGRKTLVAATPEQLVAINNGTISCDALAGTGERGTDTIHNNLLAHRLLQDPKMRQEHRLVVEHLRQRLSQISAHLSIADSPSVLPLGHLQHLWTPIKAQCRPGVSLFELAATLHPTPAVAGTPVNEARRWIGENETFNRGWYSGGVGWVQTDGNGELAVLLRNALLSDNCATLYAGAGIVADSDAKAELDETELKLRTILGALDKTEHHYSEYSVNE